MQEAHTDLFGFCTVKNRQQQRFHCSPLPSSVGALHHLAREFRAVAPDQPASLPSRGICPVEKFPFSGVADLLQPSLVSAMVLCHNGTGEVLMPNEAASGPAPDDQGDAPPYPADLTAAMQAELAPLADIETNYAGKRHRLEDWAGSQKMKERIVREVEVRHKREREPH